MSAAYFAIGIAGLIALIVILFKMSTRGERKHGATRARAEILSESAKVHARADEALAEPIPDDVPAAWDEYVDGVSDADRS